MTNSAPSGWYTDSSDPGVERWWDGAAYTQSRPKAPGLDSQQAYDRAGFGATSVSPKSRTVAVVLGFFLGGLGIDRFYLGNTGMGVAKLLVGWATLGIWPLIDWIIILVGSAHDGDGLPVTDWS